jgi:hypothetical protein
METKKVSRWRASGLHLLISAAIAALAVALVALIWYPGPLAEAAGGYGLLYLLVGVDVIVGPLITLIVFKSGKPRLKLDLATIAVLQLVALFYGMHIVYLARPAFIVFVKDQFQLTRAVDLEPAELAKAKYPQFKQAPITGPLLAFAEMPTDPAERNALVMAAIGGHDLEEYPATYAPYAEHAKEVLARSWPLARMRVSEPLAAKVVDPYLAKSGIKESDVRFLRLRAPQAWVAVLIDARTAEPLKMLISEKIEL